MTYRVDVVACNVTEAVRRVGGWIFDRAIQGWVVNVVLPQPGDTRPVQILGASVNAPSDPDHCALQVFLEATEGSDIIEHRLSAAARLFKAQALIAAQSTPIAGMYETLFASAWSTTAGPELVERQPLTAVSPS